MIRSRESPRVSDAREFRQNLASCGTDHCPLPPISSEVSRCLAPLAIAQPATETPSLTSIESSPDARGLVRCQGVLQAGLAHRTFITNSSCGCRRRFFLRRREECVAFDAAASSRFSPGGVWFPHQIAQRKQCAIPLLSGNHITTMAVCEFPICRNCCRRV